MKINSIINRYIFLEIIPPFAITLVFFTFIFMMTSLLEITNMVVNYHISLLSVVLLLVYTTPFFLSYVIPMSVMMAILLIFLRLSGDNEIMALKATGVSLYGLLAPVLLFSLLGCLATGYMTVYGIPWGKQLFKKQVFDVAKSNLEIGLRERTFNDSFEGVMIYVNKIEIKNKTLVDVFIEDQREKNVVSTAVAPEGKLFYDPENLSTTLRLFDGIINQVALTEGSSHTIRFDTYDIGLDLNQEATPTKNKEKHRDEMNLGEIKQWLNKSPQKNGLYYRTLMDFHKKFSIPVACLALGLLAVPLGAHSLGTGRSYGIGLGVVFFLLYYVLLTAGWAFGKSGAYPPMIGMWVPNAVMAGIGIFLLTRVANDRPIHFKRLSVIKEVMNRLLKKSDRCGKC
jgi:lipopolysaccharide export system permease protein